MSTTTTHENEPREIIYTLNKCIEICTDGEKTYALAAANVRDPALKEIFQQRSEERAAFVVALQGAIQKMGAFPENQGTARGTVRRGWTDVRLALEGRKDRVVIEELLRSEKAAVDGYRNALARSPIATFPEDVWKMLQAQSAALEAGLEQARRRLVLVH